MKTTIVRPVYKKGSHRDCNNYRQIAIQTSIGKILEKHVKEQIREHMYINDFIDKQQWGFQEGKGTTGLLNKFVNNVYEELKQGKHVIITAVDYEKCFDTLDHQKLIEKLQNAGIKGEALEWFKEFLRDRTTVVKIDGKYSSENKTKKGVPQGSLLSPYLYLMYSNDLKNYLTCIYYLFADDTLLITSHKDPEIARREMEREIRKLQQWAHDNRIAINVEKTKFMHIRPKRHTEEIQDTMVFHDHDCLHNDDTNGCQCTKTIGKVSALKYLGVTIEEKFNFTKHAEQVQKKLRSFIYQLYKLKRTNNTKSLKIVYYALAASVIEYGIEAWGRADEGVINNVQRLQDKIITMIIPKKEIKKRKTRKEQYQYLNLLPIKEMYKMKILTKNYYNEELKKKEKNTRYNLRRERPYEVTRAISNYGTKTDDYIIPTIFNEIPPNILRIEKIRTAKIKIKEYLLTTITG